MNGSIWKSEVDLQKTDLVKVKVRVEVMMKCVSQFTKTIAEKSFPENHYFKIFYGIPVFTEHPVHRGPLYSRSSKLDSQSAMGIIFFWLVFRAFFHST